MHRNWATDWPLGKDSYPPSIARDGFPSGVMFSQPVLADARKRSFAQHEPLVPAMQAKPAPRMFASFDRFVAETGRIC